MLEINKKIALDKFISSLNINEITWVSGYFSGLLAKNNSLPIGLSPQKSLQGFSIIYITETGNSKFLANEIAKKFREIQVSVKVKSIEQYKFDDLKNEQNVIFVISTHGNGELPQSGKAFYEYLSKISDLSSLKYLVLALGDKNYPLFCEAGKIIDLKLHEINAKKIHEIILLDLDFAEKINEIYNIISNSIASDGQQKSLNQTISSNKKEFYTGRILKNINLNDKNSSRETRHIEILPDEDFFFESGDSIGILLSNEDLAIEGKIVPRLYSISSSFNEHNREIHLTVSVVDYIDENGKKIKGLFSNYLAKLLENNSIKFYLHKNRNFKLPSDDKDIVMIGAGTGIAPFRSFLAERNYRLAKGKNWLFFGERNFVSDFLYQTELQEYLDSGLLTHLNTAFSRDDNKKLYVQNRLKENSQKIYDWIENQAIIYICGNKDKMAIDVENTLIQIISDHGNKTFEQAKNYLHELAEQGRYLKDVY